MNDSRADKPKAAEETEDLITSARFLLGLALKQLETLREGQNNDG